MTNNLAPEGVLAYWAEVLAHRETLARVRYVMKRLRERGWPARWPRELLITYKGRE